VPIYDRKTDSSLLGKLHVYGDLLKMYTLPAHGTIFEAGKLYEGLHALEHRILTLYASYVLAHSGFYVELWTSKDFVESYGEAVYTTKYKDDDWIKDVDLFEQEDVSYFTWEWDYENERQQRLKIIFISMFCSSSSLGADGKLHHLDVAETLLEKFDKSCSNYVLVHPKLSRQDKEAFMEAKEKMKQIAGQDLILSTGEFVSKFIPDKKKRYIIEENWKSLRKRVIQNLQEKQPILIRAIHNEQLSDINERIRESRIKYETRSFGDAIKDAGVACESLLQVLYLAYISKKPVEELGFNDLLNSLREVLLEQFGSSILQDLDFIRMWRNNVVHAGREKPDSAITLQVITRAELFNELFKKKIFETR